MIVDDEWLRIGSSNLSNRSMGVDTECDVTLEAKGDMRVKQAIRAFRDRLIAEHVGWETDAVARQIESAGTLARAIAGMGSPTRSLARLDAPEPTETKLAIAEVGDPGEPIFETIVARAAPLSAARGFRAARALRRGLSHRRGDRADARVDAYAAHRVCDARERRRAGRVVRRTLVGAARGDPRLHTGELHHVPALAHHDDGGDRVRTVEGVRLRDDRRPPRRHRELHPGRFVDRDTVRRVAGKRLRPVTQFMRQRGLIAVTLVRLVPIAPFPVVNVVMSAMRVKLWHFVLGTFLGMLPGMLATTVLSDQLAAMLQDPRRVNVWI